jgi:hypothetical protein
VISGIFREAVLEDCMPILSQYSAIFFYHFSHLENLPSMLAHGLFCPNEQKRCGHSHKSIALKGIQNRRATMSVTRSPYGVVHDYVPFYFCKRSSMLLSVLHAKNVDQQHLIYIALPISIVGTPGVVFTDASANTDVPPNFFTDPADLTRLNWPAIDSLKWKMSSDAEKQSRMAEVLVYKKVDIGTIDHIIVWNDSVIDLVRQAFADAHISNTPSVRCDPIHYYTKFPDEPEQSLVTGPYFTRYYYEKCVSDIINRGQITNSPRFSRIADLLNALRKDFSCIGETAELVGLEPENDLHTEDVGTHTLSVVRNLTGSDEFAALCPPDKRLVELAAFLHDIGKGPKSRWVQNGGKQKVDPDHPIGSAKMLCRILTEEISTIKPRTIRGLVKLVCYHDLVGDILGKGRDPAQLEEIAGSKRELDMLIALGLADGRAINPFWNLCNADKIPALRDHVVAALKSSAAEDEDG